jgi:hypothetical protein
MDNPPEYQQECELFLAGTKLLATAMRFRRYTRRGNR